MDKKEANEKLLQNHHKEVQEKLELKFSSASKENEELKAAQNVLKENVADLQFQLQSREERASDLAAQVEEKNKKLKFLHSVVTEKVAELDKKEANEKLLQNHHKEVQEKLELKFSSASKENEELKAAQNVLKENVADLQFQLQSREERASDLAAQVEEKNKKLKFLHSVVTEKVAELDKKEANEKLLQNHHKEVQEKLELKFSSASKENEELKAAQNVLKENVADLQFQLQSREERASDLEAQVEEQHKKLKFLHSVVTEKVAELDKKEANEKLLQNDFKQSESHVHQLKDEIGNLKVEKKNLQEEVSGLKLQLDSSSVELERKLKQKDKITHGLHAIIVERNAELKKTQAAERKLLNDLQDMASQLRQFKCKTENLEMDKNDLKKESANLRFYFELKSKCAASLNEKLEESDRKIKQLHSIISDRNAELKEKQKVEEKLRNDLKLREIEMRQREEGSKKPKVAPQAPKEPSLSSEQQQIKLIVEAKQELQRKNPANALAIFTAALNLGSFGALTHDLFYYRALCHAQLQEYDKAAGDCSSVLSRCPQHVRACFLRAFCNVRTAKYEEAVADFKTLVSLNHKDSERYIIRAEMIRDLAANIQDYQKNLEVLGLSNNSTELDIKKAYRSLSLIHHPDKHSHSGLSTRLLHQEKFKKVSAAYHILLDAQNRKKFETAIVSLDKMKSHFLQLLCQKF